MKMVCFCEKVHFRFLYTPSSEEKNNSQKLRAKDLKLETFYYLCPQILTKNVLTQ